MPCDKIPIPIPIRKEPISNDEHFDQVSIGTRADWAGDRTLIHPFCSEIISNPIPQQEWCQRDTDNSCKSGDLAGKTPFFSQIAQDYYLYTRHFKHLRRRGVYAEVATQHPVEGSNTFFMDACLGWKGLCVEANPETHVWIHRMRSCELVPTCVGRYDGERVKFLLHGDAGGVEDTNKNKDEWKEPAKSTYLICMSMDVMMKRRNIIKLDYLSLDVEGHELEVLRGINWNDTIINTMTIETTDDNLTPIQEFLESQGYVRHIPDLDEYSRKTGLLRRDAIFLHNKVQWGKPE